MTDELERRREECLQLRAMMADSAVSKHTIGKESYGGKGDNFASIFSFGKGKQAFVLFLALEREATFIFFFFFSIK